MNQPLPPPAGLPASAPSPARPAPLGHHRPPTLARSTRHRTSGGPAHAARGRHRALGALGLALALAGCAVGPDYVRPAASLPAHFRDAPDDWQAAQPADAAPRGAWWSIFADAELDDLQQQAAAANLDLRVAEAHYTQALAAAGQAAAGLWPTVTAGASSTRSNSNSLNTRLPPFTTNSVSASVSWVPDLWGSVRRSIESARASAQESGANLGAAVLSLQSTLATDYFALRVADEQQRLLDETVTAYEHSLQLTESRYRGGVAARTDVEQARAQLEATRAQSIDTGIQRAQLEHAIAVLVGRMPEEFSIPPRPFVLQAPVVPPALPAGLLQRRPDVAVAERAAAAANAQIGVTVAAFFPSLTLSGSGGFRGPSGADLLTVPYRYWTLGPSLAMTLFDGGARSEARAQAVAAYDAQAATYRKTVLSALQNVEDNLVALRLLEREVAVQQVALDAAETSLRLTINQYKAGTVGYLNVISAQATELADRESALTLRGRQLSATVQLIAALGGGWDETQLAR